MLFLATQTSACANLLLDFASSTNLSSGSTVHGVKEWVFVALFWSYRVGTMGSWMIAEETRQEHSHQELHERVIRWVTMRKSFHHFVETEENSVQIGENRSE